MAELKLKGNRVQITITLEPKLAMKLTQIAKETGRTLSGLCGWLIKQGMEVKELRL